jgi:hypothetical protein
MIETVHACVCVSVCHRLPSGRSNANTPEELGTDDGGGAEQGDGATATGAASVEAESKAAERLQRQLARVSDRWIGWATILPVPHTCGRFCSAAPDDAISVD